MPSSRTRQRPIRTILPAMAAALTLGLLTVATPASSSPPDHARAPDDAGPPDHVGAPDRAQGCRQVPESKIGVQLWTLRSELSSDVEGTLQAIAEAGYQNVEPYSFYDYTAEEFADLLDEYGLNAPSMHTNVDALANDLDQVIADAQAIGARFVTLAWVAPDWRTEDGVEELAEILDEAGEELRRNGIQLVYHNHDFEFTTEFSDGRTMFETLADSTDPRLVKFQLDLYWVVAGGADVAEVADEYKSRIVTYHVKDRAEDGSFADVGEGTIDFAEIFELGPVRYYLVENDAPDDAIDSINDSFANLTDLCV